jgi:hypothetical protein
MRAALTDRMAYNRPMHSEQLVRILAGVPGTQVSTGPGVVSVSVPAIGDAVRLVPADVLAADPIIVPTGATAVQLEVRRGPAHATLIVTVDDVVFMPANAADMMDAGARIRVPAAPRLVAYSEMHRDVRALGRAVDEPALELDPDTLAATLLLHRCFLAGAMRAGLWPVRVAAWWEYTWARVGGGLPLAPFRADPAWDALMNDVTEARRHAAGRDGSRTMTGEAR